MKKYIVDLKGMLLKCFQRVGRYARYYRNEAKHRLGPGGDRRCVFEKHIHRCRYLELPNIINNPGVCERADHQ